MLPLLPLLLPCSAQSRKAVALRGDAFRVRPQLEKGMRPREPVLREPALAGRIDQKVRD